MVRANASLVYMWLTGVDALSVERTLRGEILFENEHLECSYTTFSENRAIGSSVFMAGLIW